MPAWTLAEAQEMLQLLKDAEKAILLGHQEYRIADRTYRRADMEQIRIEQERFETLVERLEAGAPRGPVFRQTRIVERR
jgi:hypothetical protein